MTEMTPSTTTVYVTGGGGYVGSKLVPALLAAGYGVTVIDLFIYGIDVLDAVKDHPRLTLVKGDLRDSALVRQSIQGATAVIHLACISNDPSFELDPDLGKSINYDAFKILVDAAKEAGVRRFIYASSSSVYGIKDEPNVTEDLPRDPLTDYSKYKAMCEDYLAPFSSDDFVTLTLRPATVCGWSPRLRLDLTVNILTNFAINKGEITVFGGNQMRPNIHIDDMVRAYLHVMTLDGSLINGKIYNVGYENYTVSEIAQMVKDSVGSSVTIKTIPTDDNRSYHISSQKIKDELGFAPIFTISDAIRDLKQAFDTGKISNSFDDPRYFNIKMMQKIKLV